MNRTVLTIILTASLSASLGISSLVAEDREVVNVPFAFHVQSKMLPAGPYELKRFKGTTNFALFSLVDTQGRSSFIAAPLQRSADPEHPKLTFACRRGDCSLTNIDLPGSEVSYGVVQNKTNYTLELAPQIQVPITH